MNDIYANIIITDIKTGEIIPNDRPGWDMVAKAYLIGYNWQADRFNEQIDSWNSEFDKMHPDHGDLTNDEDYEQFIIDRWQPIIDQYNDAMAVFAPVKFEIENTEVVMFDGWGHKVSMNLVMK